MLELDLPATATLPPEAAGGCVVAIDAGATKTKAMAFGLADGVAREGDSGSGNQDAVGVEAALGHIEEAIGQAAAGRPVSAVLLAVAGTDPAGVREGIRAHFSSAAYVDVVNDVIGAWGSAFGGEDGLALIAGTGSHGVGVFGGRAIRVGGWGHIFGDEGSAWSIGRAAIGAALFALDGRGPATSLTAAIEAAFDGRTLDQIVPDLYESENLKAETANLARAVDAAAREGDAVAAAIITRTADDLADHVAALAAGLELTHGVSVGLVGSTWKSDGLREGFGASLARRADPLPAMTPRMVTREPVEGVLALALRAIGRGDALGALGW